MKIGKQKPNTERSSFVCNRNYSWKVIDFYALREEWASKVDVEHKKKAENRPVEDS